MYSYEDRIRAVKLYIRLGNPTWPANTSKRKWHRNSGWRGAADNDPKAAALGVCVIDVRGFPLTSSWHMVHHASQKLSPVALAFRQYLLEDVRRGHFQR